MSCLWKGGVEGEWWKCRGMFLSFVCDHSSIHSLTHPISQSSFNLLLLFIVTVIVTLRHSALETISGLYPFKSIYVLNCYY